MAGQRREETHMRPGMGWEPATRRCGLLTPQARSADGAPRSHTAGASDRQ